ncbi:hypothetical protein NPIL_611811 [Nephila pilipes]|uniref:Uncharacterized protein n=1 Tax=Nephila pilipes TaxID=299642 RepID=A0A8X6U0R5_NEPPI|nr:hypothetical protein NPIL_611811 [Nephila pilipes]
MSSFNPTVPFWSHSTVSLTKRGDRSEYLNSNRYRLMNAMMCKSSKITGTYGFRRTPTITSGVAGVSNINAFLLLAHLLLDSWNMPCTLF